MTLILDIARTHVFSRVRQTLVGMLGVAMGVGFSIMMAALMEGSQRDFVSQAVLRWQASREQRRVRRSGDRYVRAGVGRVHALCRDAIEMRQNLIAFLRRQAEYDALAAEIAVALHGIHRFCWAPYRHGYRCRITAGI